MAKYAAPNPGASQRMDLRGESSAGGVLKCLWLDAEFRAVDSAFSPFGGSAFFEFDADASAGRIYLLATVSHGFAAAAAVMRDQAWHWFFSAETVQAKGTLFAPAVSAQGDSAAMAIIAVSESGSRKILRGRISIRDRIRDR